jgi:PadR family transcriptional regulator PadR
MRRKAGQLVALEQAVCAAAADLHGKGTTEFYGYLLAKHLGEVADRQSLTGYGTLYRALSRLEDMGLLTSRWEDPQIAARESRPGRRLYTLTAAGAAAAKPTTPVRAISSRKKLAPA